MRVLAIDQVAYFLSLDVYLWGTEGYLDLLSVFLRVGLLVESNLLPILTIDVLDGLKETRDHLLDILPLYLWVILDLLHEQPRESRGEILDISLKISYAVYGWGANPSRREVCNEYKLIIDIPAQFPKLQQEGKYEMIFILAKHEALILVDILIPIL